MSDKLNARETEWQRRKRIDAEREAYVAEHGSACQICGTVPKTRGLQWDHDHKTGAHRGWLCHRCNRALPSWITPAWLIRAAIYLDGRGSVSMRAHIQDGDVLTFDLATAEDLEAVRGDLEDRT